MQRLWWWIGAVHYFGIRNIASTKHTAGTAIGRHISMGAGRGQDRSLAMLIGNRHGCVADAAGEELSEECSDRPIRRQTWSATDLELLDKAGTGGWELVVITANYIAYLKRSISKLRTNLTVAHAAS